MARRIPVESWEQFQEKLRGYFAKRVFDRQRFIFRGQADASWKLQTTLDRFVAGFQGDRRSISEVLLAEFRHLSAGIASADLEGEQLALCARHHGLPIDVVDWTRSVYVAAYFAFRDVAGSTNDPSAHVAVWCIDRGLLPSRAASAEFFEILDDDRGLKFNPRAVEQDGLFLRVRCDPEEFDQLLGPALSVFMIPTSERQVALEQLDAMNINDLRLFRDLDAAARTAAWRVQTTTMALREVGHG